MYRDFKNKRCNVKFSYDTYEIEDHPFLSYNIASHVKYLIVGTFPAEKSRRKFNFFYASETNLMWSLLLNIYGGCFNFQSGKEAVEERVKFLSENAIGMTDLLLKCYRKNKSSKDEDLYPILWNDIFKILAKNTDINTLILTSRTNICGALGLFKTLFIQYDYPVLELEKNHLNVLEGEFQFENRLIKVMVPYSTSKRLEKNSNTSFEKIIEMYRYSFGIQH
ncbi:hypothetical protein [Pedobacter sp. UBA4863]|uniref:hypothetical protein n=1 Tax=Pedobacter sp. UBA4863 TaxID=1947060 RepID=UPI0025CFBE91|nr:hypothetical protein [Pedobacter sp. UBA4863]